MLGRFSLALKRFYVKPRDIAIYKHDALNWTAASLINCKQHKEFLHLNEHQLVPFVLCKSLTVIAGNEIPLDEHWPEIVMLVKRQIKTYDRHVIHFLFQIGKFMAEVGEANDEFWEIMESKLVDENLCRYLNEDQAAKLMHGLCKIGKGSDELWRRLEREVSMHFLAMKPDNLKEAIEALEISSKGSKETIEKLRNYLEETQEQLQIS